MAGAELLQEPKQTELKWIKGNPEGLFYAPPGYLLIDQVSGDWYRKTTDQTLNTGWQKFSGGSPVAGILISNVDPDPASVASNGTLYINRMTAGIWFYDGATSSWYPLFAGI